MRKNVTISEKNQNTNQLLPRPHVIKSILNYAASYKVVKTNSIGSFEIILN